LDQPTGWVGLGWIGLGRDVSIFDGLGWVGSWVAEAQELIIFTFTEIHRHTGGLLTVRCCNIYTLCDESCVYKIVFFITKGLLFLWVRLGCGLVWGVGLNFQYGMGCVGLSWVEEIGPTDNSGLPHVY